MVIHQTLGNSVLARDADAVQIELLACQNRVRTGAQARTGRADRAVRKNDGSVSRIVQAGIEVPHPVVGFVGMRNAVPPQPKIQGQPLGGAPVVLNIRGPRNVVPVAAVLNRKLVIGLSVTQQEIGKVNPGVVTVEGEEALGLTEQILDLLINRPAAAELELMRSLGPGNVVTNLVVVRLVVPGPAGRGVFGAGDCRRA